MALPWLQIVQLVPSILDVSRELLRRAKRPPPLELSGPPADAGLAQRIAMLEENEQRQAELVNQMAEQIAGLTRIVVTLQRRMVWMGLAALLAVVVAIASLASAS